LRATEPTERTEDSVSPSVDSVGSVAIMMERGTRSGMGHVLDCARHYSNPC
jgi:hypothetical protein